MSTDTINPVTITPAQGGLASSRPVVDTRIHDASDIAIRDLWNALRTQQLPREGGINFSKLVVNIERDPANAGTPCLELFNRLTQHITTQYGLAIRPLDATPLSLQDFAGDIQRQLFDNSLMKIWEKIKKTHRGLPNFASASDIRTFLNDNANTEQLNAITELDLYGLGLHVVPPEICKLTQLQDLNLSRNQLTAIPDLSALTQLQRLCIWSNQLTAIPDLSALTQLEELHLNNNQLTAIPDLSALTQLRTLDLSNNQLTATPDLSALTQLRILYLGNNQLTAIPDLSALTQLLRPDLSLGHNPCTMVSNSNTSALPQELNSNDNPLTESPSPVRPEGFIQQFIRGISLLFTNFNRCLTECFRFLRGKVFGLSAD